MYKLFGSSLSGNCHKVRLALAQLHCAYEWQELDILQGAARTPEFLAINPGGTVPVLEVAPGQYLLESNAILCYLADGSELWPAAPLARAQTLQWLFFEQSSHAPCLAVARRICLLLAADHPQRADLPQLHKRGYRVLDMLEQHLAQRAFLVDEHYSIADIALFPYTDMAAQGGFELQRYPALRAWLQRVKAQPNFVAMR
jgi:glutathione S-transferase